MFASARLKLTLWYILIIMIISAMFSFIIYKVILNEVERFENLQRFRVESRIQEGMPYNRALLVIPVEAPEIIEETRQRILFMLGIINGAVFVMAGVFAYILAGKTLQPIQDMVEEQHRFISDASHELRTPLTSLKTAFEVYRRTKKHTGSETNAIMDESIVEVNRLQSLAESMLLLAQYQTPHAHSHMEKLPLQSIMDDAIKKVSVLAKQKNITIQSVPTDIRLEANPYGLTDLFVILLDNAIKYSDPKKKIHINVRSLERHALISVEDHGMGIAKKDISHIFDRFYRADNARLKLTHGGYGLGLSIAKKIVDIHHGTMRVDSTLGKGTTFTVKLPLKQP
jgi:two-component system, OmpR family, sensor histidine kinase CiaH